MRASVALPTPESTAQFLADAAARAAAFVERRRWWILGGCIAGYWAFVAVIALAVSPHNGWLYQHGDDGGWYWTSAWTLSSLHLPFTAVGFGWPYLMTPFAEIFGANMADGIPAIVALNVGVLAPAAIVGMYLLGERIAGRLFGVWTSMLWVMLPIASVLLYAKHARWVLTDTFLPTALGLNALSDYPSEVCAIFAAYLVLRTIDTGDVRDGSLAGIVLGFLLLLKPSNAPLVIVAAVFLLGARRFRPAVAAAAAMAPSIAALALWKQKGRDLLFSPTGPSGTPSPSGGGGHAGGLFGHVDNAVHRLLDIPGAYLSFDWHHMGQNLRALQEVFWSVRLLEFLLVAGVIALLVRGRRRGLFVVAWFLAIALVKGASSQASVFDTSLYRYLLPAWPAWVLIVASVVFFWPRGAEARKRSTVPRASPQAPSRPSNGLLVGSLLVLGLIPLTLTLAATRTPAGTIAQMVSGALVPIVDFRLTAKQTGPHSVALTWRGLKTGQTASVYRVFSGPNDGCHVTNEGTPRCLFHMPKMWWTERAVATASDAKPGRVTYRVALAADWRFDANSEADLVLLSKPVTITVR
ncbi:MAG TPA: hypothetical protein VIL77_11380 [Gaiellaceae bacterium]